MEKQKFILLMGLLLVLSLPVHSQNVDVQYADREIVKTGVYAEVTGEPYLFEGWRPGNVVYKDGTVAKDMDIKYDQVSNDLLFKKGDAEYSFPKPVKEFTILGKLADVLVFKSGYPAHGQNDGNTFYQVLAEGDGIAFLKRNNKSIAKQNVYGSSTIHKLVRENVVYYFYEEGKGLKTVKKDAKSILALLDKSKKPTLEDFIRQEKLKFKEDGDLIALLEFYQTL